MYSLTTRFVNMFAEKPVEPTDVVIPYGEAHRRSSNEKPNSNVKDKDDSSVSSGSAGGFSIESLRAEIDGDLAVEGHTTAYDRMYWIHLEAMSLLMNSIPGRDPLPFWSHNMLTARQANQKSSTKHFKRWEWENISGSFLSCVDLDG